MTTGGIPVAVGLVVPVFDEEERIGEFCSRLLDFIVSLPDGSELLIVDDGSNDETVAIAHRLLEARPGVPARVLQRPHRGKGAAVAAGLGALTTPLRAFCDVDLSTPLEDLRRIVAAGARPGVIAIGSRDLTASRLVRPQSAGREGLGRIYNRLLQATVTPGIVDTQCGAKSATEAVWQAVLPHCGEAGFAWDAEAVGVAVALGLDVQEIPIEWQHDERSKVHVLRDGVAMVIATRRIWLSARRASASASAIGRRGQEGEVFDDSNAAKLIESDRTHWWFRSKAAFVSTALRRTGGTVDRADWLVDAGGGAGGVTALLGWAPERVLVVEGNGVLVAQAMRSHGLHGMRAEVGALPLRRQSTAVLCLLDVIEHLEDPVASLMAAREALAPGGRLVINVPAHRWLWSQADVELGHVRRYTRASLRADLAAAGFEPVLMTHVFSWLVPPVWLTRRVVRPGTAELGLDKTSWFVSTASMVLTWLERQLVGRIALPVGTSILCVALRE